MPPSSAIGPFAMYTEFGLRVLFAYNINLDNVLINRYWHEFGFVLGRDG